MMQSFQVQRRLMPKQPLSNDQLFEVLKFFVLDFFFEILFSIIFSRNFPSVARGDGLSNGLRESPTIFLRRPFQYQSNNVESRDPETI